MLDTHQWVSHTIGALQALDKLNCQLSKATHGVVDLSSGGTQWTSWIGRSKGYMGTRVSSLALASEDNWSIDKDQGGEDISPKFSKLMEFDKRILEEDEAEWFFHTLNDQIKIL